MWKQFMSCINAVTDEYWSNHAELHDIPIYYASSLAKRCMSVYQTYINAMNSKIQREISHRNPFLFKHISNLKVLLVATWWVYAKTMHAVNVLKMFSPEVRPFMHSSVVPNALVQVCYAYGRCFAEHGPVRRHRSVGGDGQPG